MNPGLNQDVPHRTAVILERSVIIGFAALIIILAFLLSFFMDREIVFDEIGLHNPIYMFLHYGRMTYPAHEGFDYMIVHPPTHYLEIALLMKAGLHLFHAAGVPLFFFMLVNLVVIARSQFPITIKLGLMTGLYLAVFIWGSVYTVRPDLHLAVAWFGGLVALESGRIANWNAGKLFLGSFLLTYASGVHYVGSLAFTGVLVYAVWAWRALTFRNAKYKILAMAAGGCLFGIPYLLLFLIPHWERISSLATAVQGKGGVVDAFRMHIAGYRNFTNYFLDQSWPFRPLVALLTFPVLKWGIPAIILGPPLLLLHPSVRGIAFAAIPHLLFMLLYFRDPLKSAYTGYFVPEMAVYLSAILVTIGRGLEQFLKAAMRNSVWAAAPLAWIILAIPTFMNVPVTLYNRLDFVPKLVDLDVARAAGRATVGSGALVGISSAGLWYTAGADHVHFITPDLLYPEDISRIDLPRYLSYFDAFADDAHRSGLTWNGGRGTLTSWYVDGRLKLRGFYFGRRQAGHNTQSYVLLAPTPRGPIVGHAWEGSAVFRFEESPGGQFVFATLVCPSDRMSFDELRPDFFFTLFLPGEAPGTRSDQVIRIVLMRSDQYAAMFSTIASTCLVRDQIHGRVFDGNLTGMLNRLRREDSPIRFYRTFSEAVFRTKRVHVSPDAQIVFDNRQRAPAPLYQAEFSVGWKRTGAGEVVLGPDRREVSITTNRSRYDWQLVSDPIPIESQSVLLVELEHRVESGGMNVQILGDDRKSVLLSRCEKRANQQEWISDWYVLETGGNTKLTVVLANCSQSEPASSRFWVKDLKIWNKR